MDTIREFFARLALALRVLLDGVLADGVLRLNGEPRVEGALQLLGLLQREGRLIDFLREDLAGYADADVGAAARVVQERCRAALETHVTLARVRPEPEGSEVAGPSRGKLVYGGWQAVRAELAELAESQDVRVLAPAEVA